MPKFMTYQRPTPINKQSWAGRPGANPYQPVRRSTGRLVLAWVLVGIPLAFGVFQTLTQVAALFG